MAKGRSTEFRVGIFVSLALIVGTGLIFTLGARSSLFSSKNDYYAIFTDVGGLRAGSTIRLSGIEVGTVGPIEFIHDGDDVGKLRVSLQIRTEIAHLITAPTNAETGEGGTRATLGSKGLLGDMLIDITPGRGTPLADGSRIPSQETGGMFAAIAQAGEMVSEIREELHPVLENVRSFTTVLGDEQFRTDLHDIAHNVAEVTRMVAEEDGTVPRLLRDPDLANKVESTLASAQVATSEIAQTARNFRAISNEIRDGDGTVHEVIYGREGSRLVTNLADTAGEAATILRDVRTGHGNAHELLYGDDAGNLIQNLNEMSQDLRVVVAEVRAGRGTIGGLLMDPSIYEDVKRLVGNLERNDILRALVRYSIREDEPRQPRPRPTPQETVEQPVVTSRPARSDP
jgi:phospholipid/cholesterol/gamma-HCH transport system substrate-binding protein